MELILALGIIMCILLWGIQRRETKAEKAVTSEEGLEGLAAETAWVVWDFLENGQAVAKLTGGKYRGAISARLHRRCDKEWGYSVSMYGTGDLSRCPAEVLEQFHLLEFEKKYGCCYDGERDAIVYITSCSLSMTQEQQNIVERRLYHRIKTHPLAAITANAQIQTRNLGLE